jgi:tape measure domain-containing protein
MSKVAGVNVDVTANATKLLTELEKSRKEILLLRKTVDHSANRIKYAFNSIRRAAQVVASAFIFAAGIRRLGQLVAGMARAEDQVKLMQARFQQFARAGDAFTRVYDLSKRLGVSLQDTADGMTRLLVATKEMGTAQPIIEDVYQNIVLLGRAGGTSAEEMKGGMRQLSQGLASGRLAGEELRSVLENLPLVAIEIADQMKIALGQLRAVAAEGKITPDVVIAALANIEIKMEDLPKTWAMQTENLRTEWDLFLADLSRAVDEAGLLEALVDAVKWVRINMLGSFLGVSTEDLQKQAEELRRQRETPDTSLPWQDTPWADAWQDFMGMLGPNQNPNDEEYLLTRSKQLELERLINEELERRAKQEEMLARAGEARNALRQDQIDEDARRAELRELQRLQSETDKLRDSLRSDQDEFFDLLRRMDELVEKTDLTAAQAREIIARKYDELIEKANELTDAEKKALDEILEASRQTADEMDETAKRLEQMAERGAQNIQDAFSDFFFDPFEDGLKGLVKSFIDAVRRMIAESMALQFVKQTGLAELVGAAFGAATSGDGSVKVSGNALGGPVMAGVPSIVGEKGRELFIPATDGVIIPNHKLSMAGGGAVINNYFEAGADIATIETRIIPMLEETQDRTIARMMQLRAEGRA